jgi:hypothetical protein
MPNVDYVMQPASPLIDDSIFEPLLDRSSPAHAWFGETEQYRLKVQSYSNCPPEFVVQKISFQKDFERYLNAAERSKSIESTIGRRRLGLTRLPPSERTSESLENSQRRAKSGIRKLTTELAPNHFTTFTTRETGPDYFTPDDWRSMWAAFVRLVRSNSIDFEYIAVLERHPKNPIHLHLHVAWRGKANYNFLRRLWHIVVGRQMGLDIRKMVRGSDTPGNIQDQSVKAVRGSFKQVRKIAKYISKYITKDLIAEFNKRRYWPSKGIDLRAARVYWLDSLSQAEAIRESCLMLGLWDIQANACSQRVFRPSDRVCWCAVDPALSPPPPF